MLLSGLALAALFWTWRIPQNTFMLITVCPMKGKVKTNCFESVFKLERNSMGRQLVEILSAAPGGPPVRSAGFQVPGNMQNLDSSLNYTLKYGR
jgi:hypothetical protein